ncbi:hypothetical protein LUW76_36320 [Actinomadura madurae]|uniref:hypothetical protein n=1 Tax=Actinomadura madurae TaxID=1993 RepID=UPI00202629B3|nr:hypothetical protein [Actinomadura madurae]URM99360.1 hypothetical protein LUW76_36320 [Actinomadura madurae]URN10037.1 hypothetical protein LUW74_46260 [Actinomadura madurae]
MEKAASLAAPAGKEDEAFRLRKRDGGLLLQASTSAGTANGLYAIADRIRSGTEVLPDDQDGRVVAPALPLRLTDHGSVGLTADEPAFAEGDDYGLNTDVVRSAVLKRAPWVDASAAAIGHQFRQFVDHWFAAPAHLVLVLGAWLAFALALRWLTRGRDRFALSAAIGGVALGRTVILLVALAGRGPGRYWYDFWTEPGLRSLYITVAFAAFCWTFAIAYRVLRDAYGLSVRRATGVTLIGAGAPPAALGSLVAAIGLEDVLTMWNDQMALLPWGLLGITTYLGIPAALPAITAGAGAVLVASGALLAGRTAARAERA